jgi:hypothetical protein
MVVVVASAITPTDASRSLIIFLPFLFYNGNYGSLGLADLHQYAVAK